MVTMVISKPKPKMLKEIETAALLSPVWETSEESITLLEVGANKSTTVIVLGVNESTMLLSVETNESVYVINDRNVMEEFIQQIFQCNFINKSCLSI